ncbi:uncharacterized protein LOC115444085 [Manduca sexta]|uniref:uncharacterized protein LOC115444085 n=1 Tax=Manduca sexta TaxID=7130 RepID=UPI00188EACFA|nr:uncharacterized protein LOC115444085 [Manduca sexta]
MSQGRNFWHQFLLSSSQGKTEASKMLNIIVVFLALAISALGAELPPSYSLVEKQPFKPELNMESLETHAVYKKEPKSDTEHPVYKPEEHKNQGRARIEPVRPSGSMGKYDRMLADQPTGSTEINRIDNPTNFEYDHQPSEVTYPDVPYAPGYGYESGYPTLNNYDMYRNDYMMEPDTSAYGLLWSQVPDARTLVSYVGRTISWIFGSMFMIFFGSVLTIGVCTYTNLCTFAFNGVGPINDARSLLTPERLENLSTAADFVKTAINKYQKIQKVAEMPARNRRNAFYGM